MRLRRDFLVRGVASAAALGLGDRAAAEERLLHALVVRDSQLVGVLSFRDVAVADDLADHRPGNRAAEEAGEAAATTTPVAAARAAGSG